jgi:hypothetical protein
MNPDPAIFVIDLQDANEKLIYIKVFLLFEGKFTSFFKESKRSHKIVGIEVFSFYFCFMIEGSGSVPLTNGSGWPKNIRIRRIRIRNTGYRILSSISQDFKLDPVTSQGSVPDSIQEPQMLFLLQ